ncbi:S-adenosyl-L-methionine-dependent methyltransferase [Kalaharituber pfeilii]|nr:S-adenosyl-L-methionine-dependent methyltransferase [Kalaharituber pfeilii]
MWMPMTHTRLVPGLLPRLGARPYLPQSRSRPLSVPPSTSPTVNSTLPSHHVRPHTTISPPPTDASEIHHFTALASTWWDPHGPSRLLHLMNPIRIQFIQRCLALSARSSPFHSSTSSPATGEKEQQQGPGLTYLDVGCGGGILTESLARLRGTKLVVGVDPTAAVIRVAEEHMRRDPALVRSGKLIYLNSTAEDLAAPSFQSQPPLQLPSDSAWPEVPKRFEVITAMEVLEHVPSPSAFLSTLSSLVAPGGWLILSTIARHPVSYLTTKLVAEGLLRIVPWGTHEWGKYVNVDELEGWVRRLEGRGEGRGEGNGDTGGWRTPETVVMGVVYVPGVGWREMRGGEKVGNYFFGVRKAAQEVQREEGRSGVEAKGLGMEER